MKIIFFLSTLLIMNYAKCAVADDQEPNRLWNSIADTIDNFDSEALASLLFIHDGIDHDILDSALLYSAYNKHDRNQKEMRNIIQELILAGANINYQDKKTLDTFLIVLIKNPHSPVALIKTVIELGAPQLKLKNRKGEYPALLAYKMKKYKILNLLSA